ncbi:hypothetical protein A3Q56_05246 [Intoshia linei]|uniref:DH domain-containing protein n=1 Tax=Intoshia linei TaxID=1819745 RepID=A0A177AYI2_9BILA|nr:hypothetical protein A3Q56_05246 [Intoshia linei]
MGQIHGKEGIVDVIKVQSLKTTPVLKNCFNNTNEIDQFCKTLQSQKWPLSINKMNSCQRFYNVIMELVDTEKKFIQDMKTLNDRFINPMRFEKFLPNEIIENLYCTCRKIIEFHENICESFESAVEDIPDILENHSLQIFNDFIIHLCNSFIFFAHNFRIYSSYCSYQSKLAKYIKQESSEEIKNFLDSRNPNCLKELSFETFIIKPIQRILKYPLLIRQLNQLIEKKSCEKQHLEDTVQALEAVAEHVNEMQKISDDYDDIFTSITRDYQLNHPSKPPADIVVSELQMYGTVKWLNSVDFIGKSKKKSNLLYFIFVFLKGVVIMAQSNKYEKKNIFPTKKKVIY